MNPHDDITPGGRHLAVGMIMKIHKQATFLEKYANDLSNLLRPRIIKLGC